MKRYNSTGNNNIKRTPVKADHDILVNDLEMDDISTVRNYTSLKKNNLQNLKRTQSLSPIPRYSSLDSLVSTTYKSPQSMYMGSPGRLHIHDKFLTDNYDESKFKDKLDRSEERRSLLINKLKEAHSTMQVQTERLNKIEDTARDNDTVVEDLKIKEKLYREKIENLEKEQKNSKNLKDENAKLRTEMQNRVSSLDMQLKILLNQQQNSDDESGRRAKLLKQMTAALTELEDENHKFRDVIYSSNNILVDLITCYILNTSD